MKPAWIIVVALVAFCLGYVIRVLTEDEWVLHMSPHGNGLIIINARTGEITGPGKLIQWKPGDP